MSDLNALVGIDFSLIGTQLHAAYEKRGEDGYAILLMPSEQMADNGVSIGEVIEDIKKMVNKVNENADTTGMEADLNEGLSSLSENKGTDQNKFELNKLMVKLQMAYLYIEKTKETSVLEYAFQIQIISKDVIPAAIRELVSVDNISFSVWNTNRKKVIDKMALVTIGEYIGIEQNESSGK
ncbi:MAG: hypothetical protein ACLRZ9_04340 [Eubacterium sp.]